MIAGRKVVFTKWVQVLQRAQASQSGFQAQSNCDDFTEKPHWWV